MSEKEKKGFLSRYMGQDRPEGEAAVADVISELGGWGDIVYVPSVPAALARRTKLQIAKIGFRLQENFRKKN